MVEREHPLTRISRLQATGERFDAFAEAKKMADFSNEWYITATKPGGHGRIPLVIIATSKEEALKELMDKYGIPASDVKDIRQGKKQ